MAQVDAMKRYVKNNNGSPSEQTMEQLLHSDDPYWATHTSPTFAKNHDHEEHDHHTKKSVLTKVKEKAKKLKHTLSKKKHSHDDNATPAWGVSLETDDEDDDPDHYGAPMFESAKAPANVIETARQHPREDLVISEKHVLPSNIFLHRAQVQEDTTSKRTTESVQEKSVPTAKMNTSKTISESVTVKPASTAKIDSSKTISESVIEMPMSEEKMDTSKTISESVVEKPVSTEKLDTIKTISESVVEKPELSGTIKTGKPTPKSVRQKPSRLETMNTTSKPITESVTEKVVQQETATPTSKTITETFTEKLAPAYAMASGATGMITSRIHNMAIATSAALSPKESPKDKSIIEKKYDKGVSVKEYLRQKLEPGEDEKALSQVISEAISPRKENIKREASKGVVEKVRGAVSSYLATQSSSSIPRNTSSNNIPVSTNACAVEEDRNEGRILQAN